MTIPFTSGAPDPLQDFERRTFSSGSASRDVYYAGAGPAVVVMSEVPGITPAVADFARRVVARGMTSVMPDLFGTPGRAPSVAYSAQTLSAVCISREFTLLATGRASPVTVWLRTLARHAHVECGGPGVGAVGMCLTGGFALAMMVDDTTVAPVLSQPSLPLPLGDERCADPGIGPDDLARVKERAGAGTPVLGLRFTCDRLVPAARFDTLARELGDGFIRVEIDSSPGNRHGIPRIAHSVLTEHLVDEVGHPTREALDQVLDFLADRLGV